MARFIFCFLIALICFSSPCLAVNGDEYFHYSCNPQRGVKVTYRALTTHEDSKSTNTWSLDDLKNTVTGIGKHIIKTCQINDGSIFKIDMTASPYNFGSEGQCSAGWFAQLKISDNKKRIYFDGPLEQATWCLHDDNAPIIEEVRANSGGVYLDKVTHEAGWRHWERGELISGPANVVSRKRK